MSWQVPPIEPAQGQACVCNFRLPLDVCCWNVYIQYILVAVHASRDFQASSPPSAQEVGMKQATVRDLFLLIFWMRCLVGVQVQLRRV